VLPKFSFRLLLLLLVLALAVPLFAITGGPADMKCPLCNEKNTLWEWWSYGSYIYHWPSKFHLIFWPYTDSHNLFLCAKCHFTAFSGDWREPPKEKLEDTRKLLLGIAAPVIPAPDLAPGDKEEEKAWKRMVYAKVPISERLKIAEEVYALWGRDDEWWCHFYRVKGYHLEEEKKLDAAKEARQKALELALKLANDPNRAGQKKQFLFIAGSMRYYTGDPNGALADFRIASATDFRHPKTPEENNKGYTEYLNGIIKEFIAAMEAGRRPDADSSKDPH
jgi:hypothetical protein